LIFRQQLIIVLFMKGIISVVIIFGFGLVAIVLTEKARQESQQKLFKADATIGKLYRVEKQLKEEILELQKLNSEAIKSGLEMAKEIAELKKKNKSLAANLHIFAPQLVKPSDLD
jgi:dsDNA-specific endonuclease/ATPase MutS2